MMGIQERLHEWREGFGHWWTQCMHMKDLVSGTQEHSLTVESSYFLF